MRTRIISSLAAATLLLSACGGGASGSQGEALDLLMESASEEGIDVEKGCAEDIASKLSDEDAKTLVDAGGDGDADLSPEGEALTLELLSCVDMDSLIDSIMEQIGDEEGIDEDCMRDLLKGLDQANLAAGNIPDAGFFECFDLDG